MEGKVLVCFWFLIGLVQGLEVQLDGKWQQDVGWVVNCSWQLFPNDSLQSVRLYDNHKQFMVYRPQNDGNHRIEHFPRTEDTMIVECTESIPRGLIGTCILTVIPFQSSAKPFTYSCEVSGERPKFWMQKKDYNIYWIVSPTGAMIEAGPHNPESGRVLLNCTSSGWPAPNLQWKIGDQYVPSDFKSSIWNTTSKLWHAWSLLTYTPSTERPAVCTPEILQEGLYGSLISKKGIPAIYNSAGQVKDIKNIVFTMLTTSLLLRR